MKFDLYHQVDIIQNKYCFQFFTYEDYFNLFSEFLLQNPVNDTIH